MMRMGKFCFSPENAHHPSQSAVAVPEGVQVDEESVKLSSNHHRMNIRRRAQYLLHHAQFTQPYLCHFECYFHIHLIVFFFKIALSLDTSMKDLLFQKGHLVKKIIQPYFYRSDNVTSIHLLLQWQVLYLN